MIILAPRSCANLQHNAVVIRAFPWLIPKLDCPIRIAEIELALGWAGKANFLRRCCSPRVIRGAKVGVRPIHRRHFCDGSSFGNRSKPL